MDLIWKKVRTIVDPWRMEGTDFQKMVWEQLLAIPHGETRTYKQIAEEIGRPRASRAVANACGANPLPITVPCHRAVRADGSLGGYSGEGGVKTKEKLLRDEGSL